MYIYISSIWVICGSGRSYGSLLQVRVDCRFFHIHGDADIFQNLYVGVLGVVLNVSY